MTRCLLCDHAPAVGYLCDRHCSRQRRTTQGQSA
jgi:hypothetical protein